MRYYSTHYNYVIVLVRVTRSWCRSQAAAAAAQAQVSNPMVTQLQAELETISAIARGSVPLSPAVN